MLWSSHDIHRRHLPRTQFTCSFMLTPGATKNHFPSVPPTRPLLPARPKCKHYFCARPTQKNDELRRCRHGAWVEAPSSHSAGAANSLLKHHSAMTHAVASGCVSISGPCTYRADGNLYARSAWSPNAWMVKLLVFAERAINGLPSANPCVRILDRAMRTNLLY